jgi:signal transduction histidine kinase
MTLATGPRVRSGSRTLHTQLFSLQTKLVLAMTALIVLSVVAAGVVFVLRTRDDRRDQALERLAAAAPGIYQATPFNVVVDRQGGPDGPRGVEALTTSIDNAAFARGVRVILVTEGGQVLHDTEGGLTGEKVSYPVGGPEDAQRGYASWRTNYGTSDITFVGSAVPVPVTGAAAGGGTFVTEVAPFVLPGIPGPGAEERIGMLMAARSQTIENAWLSALPGVGIATPFAVIVAVFLARQIARPVHQLTLASEAMARGDFDQRVEVEREDEVGRLAKAFSVMAQRVGERDTQMRSLIANVSHDLKTPMSSILGYSQALRDGVTDDHTRVADVINTQAQHAHRLLDDLLFLSEVDSGQVLGQVEDTPAGEVIERGKELLEHRAEEAGLTFETVIEEGLILPGVDRDRVVRALANVLDNAIRFAVNGSAVTIRAFADGEASIIEVANDGPRIREEELPHIFERFYRGSSGTSGHGLGLAIAREAVVISKGAIWASNTPTGVEVRMRFPA